jgi:hypothetical protein
MKLICIIDNDFHLTIGKIYNVLLQDKDESWLIIDDIGRQMWYWDYNGILMPLEEWRDKQLNKLGI